MKIPVFSPVPAVSLFAGIFSLSALHAEETSVWLAESARVSSAEILLRDDAGTLDLEMKDPTGVTIGTKPPSGADAKFSSASQYNYLRRPVWYSRAFGKMPAGRSFNANTQWYWGTAWGMNVYLWENSSPLNSPNFDGYINRAPNRSKLVLVGEKNRNGGHFFDPRTPPRFEKDVETQYRVSRDGKAYYLFGDFHIELIEGDQSVATNPTFRTYDPNNRLYYAW